MSLATIVIVMGLAIGSIWLYLHPSVKRTTGVVYGQRGSRSLALDVIHPDKPNGYGVILVVSGGWMSSPPGSIKPWILAPLLRRGYTVFPVYHVSQPEATVTEITADMNRAVRFIRYHAGDYGVNPQRLGIIGGSAGGHLSLLLATRGGPGPADASDPVDRESSAVQAVAIFFPVTDLLNLGSSILNPGNGGPPKTFEKAFGPQATNLSAWKVIGRDLSPIYHVHSNQPPILIYHGDADTLVPLDQSERFEAESKKQGCIVKVDVHRKGGHGWWSMVWDLRHFADWFDRYLQR